jgi:aspartyl-tRNA(Asn)/glutamyl-tRNA(Gln) amidotransferase subunit A
MRWDATHPADLGVVEAVAALAGRELSATELVQGCLDRIRERDGVHSREGDTDSINAWVRVYEEDALSAAAVADERLREAAVRRDGTAPPLCGVPVGLKDLFAVEGKPLTASSALLDEIPSRSSDVWQRLQRAGAVLLGHTHTHEFAAGGITDQVGNPWALERSAGGSSGGSAAALAGRMVPAAVGTDTAGSLRIPSALCGTSTIKPTRGLVSMQGVVPLAPTLDHAGPMARSIEDCAVLLGGMAGPDIGDATTAFAPPAGTWPGPANGAQPLAGLRVAVSPRLSSVSLDPDVADGFDLAVAALRRGGARVIGPAAPPAGEVGRDHFLLMCSEMLAWHRRFDDRRERYLTPTREFLEFGERAALSAEDYVRLQGGRRETTARWAEWLAADGIAALIEPTVPMLPPHRGEGHDHAGSDADLVVLTYLWNWTGFPVVTLPAGVGARSGLPVSVSLIGPPGTDGYLLRIGAALQRDLGVPSPTVDA